jgi:hypothetical protein
MSVHTPAAQQDPQARGTRAGGQIFVLVTVSVALVVAGAGWLTGLERAYHSLLLTLAVIALLPCLIIAGLLLFLVALALAIAIAGDATADIVDAGAAEGIVQLGRLLSRHYYGVLFRERNPIPLGIGAGVGLGTLVVFGLLSILVVPKETCTLARMLAAQRGIEHYYDTHGVYPAMLGNGALSMALMSPGEVGLQPSCKPDSQRDILLDGFGRPIVYQTHQRLPRVAYYRLTSLGSDGRKSGDDLCVAGATQAERVLQRVATDLQSMSALQALLVGDKTHSSQGSWRPWWAALRTLDCNE